MTSLIQPTNHTTNQPTNKRKQTQVYCNVNVFIVRCFLSKPLREKPPPLQACSLHYKTHLLTSLEEVEWKILSGNIDYYTYYTNDWKMETLRTNNTITNTALTDWLLLLCCIKKIYRTTQNDCCVIEKRLVTTSLCGSCSCYPTLYLPLTLHVTTWCLVCSLHLKLFHCPTLSVGPVIPSDTVLLPLDLRSKVWTITESLPHHNKKSLDLHPITHSSPLSNSSSHAET